MGIFSTMKFVSLVFIIALICAAQCSVPAQKDRKLGQVCDAVLYVANACMASQNVPANVQSAVQSAISSNLGSWRRLGLYDQALNAGCTAAYNAACSAAGVPSVVQQCFQRDMVNACVNKIHELGGRRALGKKGKKCGKACKAMKKAKKSKKGKRELAKKKGKGKGKGKGKKGGKRKLGGCVAGYWPFHTRNTLNDSKFGPWNCISAGVPCAMATSTSAAKKLVKDDWKANGGQSFKYIANGYCTGEKSGSNPWVNPSGITWRFSLLRRRLGMKADKGRRMGAVCDAVLYVANACMNGHNVPAAVQGVITSGITSALGAFRRRRLGFYDDALNAGCTAAYNAAAGAAGVPPAVATCFRNDIVNTCVAKIHELGGRRLAKKH